MGMATRHHRHLLRPESRDGKTRSDRHPARMLRFSVIDDARDAQLCTTRFALGT